jgi:hypothetical protein
MGLLSLLREAPPAAAVLTVVAGRYPRAAPHPAAAGRAVGGAPGRWVLRWLPRVVVLRAGAAALTTEPDDHKEDALRGA